MKAPYNYLNITSKTLILVTLFLFAFTSCKKDDVQLTDQEYRTIAWNYLNATQKATVNTKWEEAQLEKKIIENKEVVVVTFGTTQDASLGPIQVFIQVKTKNAIGIGGRF